MSPSERHQQPTTTSQHLPGDGLRLAYCRACRRHLPFGAARCDECGRLVVELAAVSGRGAVTSLTVVHRALVPSFPLAPPYVVVLVALEEGPTVPGAMPDAAPGDVQIGDLVQLRPHVAEPQLLMFERQDRDHA